MAMALRLVLPRGILRVVPGGRGTALGRAAGFLGAGLGFLGAGLGLGGCSG
jgi:hypothetical protein